MYNAHTDINHYFLTVSKPPKTQTTDHQQKTKKTFFVQSLQKVILEYEKLYCSMRPQLFVFRGQLHFETAEIRYLMIMDLLLKD